MTLGISRPLPAPLDLLVVAPHPDDAEISVGGIITKLRQNGHSVGVLELTNGEPTPHGSVELRAKETAAASALLDLTWRGNLELPNRSLEATLAARRQLAGVFRLTRPKLILAPYWEDSHPDHVAASQLVDAARFWAKLSRSDIAGEPWNVPRLLYYWSIHLRIHPQPSVVVDISAELETKMAAVRCYESQFGHDPSTPSRLDDIRDRARYWGWSIGASFGEPLASREPVASRSSQSLLQL